MERMTSEFTSNLKVGDRVWVQDYNGTRHGGQDRESIDTVVAATPSQVTLEDAFGRKRYQRRSGNEITPGHYKRWIMRLATDEEFSDWDATEGTKEREISRQNQYHQLRVDICRKAETAFYPALHPRVYIPSIPGSGGQAAAPDYAHFQLNLLLTEEQLEKVVAALK